VPSTCGAVARTVARSASSGRAQPVSTQQLPLGRAGVTADEHRRAGEVGPQRQHLAHVRVRRPRLGVQVVAVVPDHDQARGRRPGANAAARVPATASTRPRRTASQRR
jgi:hypothetical protein